MLYYIILYTILDYIISNCIISYYLHRPALRAAEYHGKYSQKALLQKEILHLKARILYWAEVRNIEPRTSLPR